MQLFFFLQMIRQHGFLGHITFNLTTRVSESPVQTARRRVHSSLTQTVECNLHWHRLPDK